MLNVLCARARRIVSIFTNTDEFQGFTAEWKLLSPMEKARMYDDFLEDLDLQTFQLTPLQMSTMTTLRLDGWNALWNEYLSWWKTMSLEERLNMWESGKFPPSCRKCVNMKWRGESLGAEKLPALRECQVEARRAKQAKTQCAVSNRKAAGELGAGAGPPSEALVQAKLRKYIDP